MKQPLSLLDNGCRELNIFLSERQLSQFQKYFDLLIEWNSYFNLTSVVDSDQVQIRHFLDSASLAATGLKFNEKTFLDVGSGAGFPGLPLKIIFPSLKLTLLEANKNKCRFLEVVTTELELENIRFINKRAEIAGHEAAFRERFDIVSARALASLDVLGELCLPFCSVGGHFIAMKTNSSQEVYEAEKCLTTMGGKLTREIPSNLPAPVSAHRILVIEKIGPTPDRYPRRVGIPNKRPLR